MLETTGFLMHTVHGSESRQPQTLSQPMASGRAEPLRSLSA